MKIKRILSIMLVLAMLFALLPVSAIAAEAEPEVAEETVRTEQTAETSKRLHPMMDEKTARDRGHTERVREDEGTDLNKLVFRNEDGTKTMYIYDHPVKYRDKQGKTHDISLEIDDTGNTKYPFRTKANAAVTEFPASLPDGIKLQGDGVSLRMTSKGEGGRRVDANTVSYTYDSKTTIEYELTYTGFKEDIVVSEYTGQTEYPFTLYTEGLYVTELDGGYYLTDDGGQIRAVIGEIIVFTADERNNTFGSLRVEPVKAGQEYALTIVLDAEYLADPNTVYPIRIDPTVELVYTDAAPNAIEEKTISNAVSTNGSAAVITVGQASGGISRALMKFPGFDFNSIEGATVISATVSIRDLMCQTDEIIVTCYPFRGGVWTESSQWSDVTQSWGEALDSHVVSYDSGRQQESAHRYRFDITALVQKWVDGYADPNMGVLFKADAATETATTAICKTFASSERSAYRPTFVIQYQDVISLEDELDVDKGSSITLSAYSVLGQEDGLTWTSSASSIASVDEDSGVVTGEALGSAVITASYVDEDGNTISASATVYVTVPDGVYYIRRTGSTMCLANEDSTVNSISTHVEAKNTSTVTDPTQFWQITYLNAGWYVIRPVDRILAVLTTDTNNNVVVKDLTQGANVQLSDRWKIVQESNDYVFQHKGLSSRALTAASLTDGANVTVAAKTSSNSCHWILQEATGLFWRDTATLRAIPTAITKTINLGQSYTLADLGLDWDYCGTRSGVSWSSVSSSDCDLLAVASNGTLTPNYGGVSTVTLTVVIDDTKYSISYGVTCILPLSRYELPYEPNLWNSNGDIKLGTRCYSYALNVQVHPENNTPWNIIVGWHSGHAYAFVGGPINMTIVESYAMDDAKELGFTFAPIDKDAVCDPGCYKVALVIDTNADYHWYRQNPDGTWSHKLAQGDVTNRDADNNYIYDPCIANKDYTDVNGKNYEDGTRYYQISPLNYLYSENYTSSATLTEQISTPVEKRLSDVNAKICFDLLSAEVALLFTEQDSEDFV